MVRAPVNPRERNFWQLLSKHRDKIPQETYDYVFYIISAAVIGENPRMFGFNFDNPLADVGNNQSLGLPPEDAHADFLATRESDGGVSLGVWSSTAKGSD